MSRFTKTWGVASLAVAALALSSCANAGDGTAAAPAGDEITVAVAALPTSYDLDGSWGASNENYTVWSQTHTALLKYADTEQDGVVVQDFTEFEGVLADAEEPYTVSDDGQTYTFNLRDDVVSQAGNPFTAEDVYWSIERKLNVAGGRLPQVADYFYSADQMEIIDDHTIAFHLDGVSNEDVFLPILTGQNGFIFDKTAVMEHATDDDPWAIEWAAQNSGWGYGPYVVDSITEGQQLVLKSNPDYALGEPEIKTVTQQVVPDSGTRAQLLAAGDVDVAEALSPNDLSAIEDDPNVQIPSVENTIEFLVLALVQNKEPFDDKLVRQAFNYAIPYDEIIEQVYQGYAQPSPGWFTPSMGVPGLSTDPAYTYDIDRAKELLDEAGKPSVDVTLSVPNNLPDVVDTALLIASHASDAGFNVQVDQLNSADFATGRAEQTLESLIAANRVQIQVPAFVNNFFLPGDPSNSGAFEPTDEWNALVDEAIEAGPSTSEEAAPHWQEVSDFINDDASHLPLLFKQPNQAYSTGLDNMAYRFDNTVNYSILTPASE